MSNEKAIKKTVGRFLSKTIIDKIDFTVPLPKSTTPLTEQAVQLNLKIEELRVKKDLEIKVKDQEELKRKQFQKALAEKPGAGSIAKLINGQRLKENDNLLLILANKGMRMTFDNEGLPMLQKQAKIVNDIIENPDYNLSSALTVTKQMKLRKGHGFLKPVESMNQTKGSSHSLNPTADQETKFEGHI